MHLNVGFRLPLVPDPGQDPAPDADPAPGPPQRRPGSPGRHSPRAYAPPRPRRPPLTGCDHRDAREALGELPTRGVLLVGDLPCTSLRGHHQWLAALAGACGWPIVHEPSANLHDAPTALGHGVLVVGSGAFLADHAPDLVLTVGQFGLSRPTMDLIRAAGRHVAIELPTVGREVCDPLRTAERVLTGIPLPPTEFTPDPGWLAAWQAADAIAADVVAAQVVSSRIPDRVGRGRPRLEAGARRRTAPRGRVMVGPAGGGVRGPPDGASRDRQPGRQRDRRARVDCLGAALAHQAQGGGVGLALMGDLAFLHDHNGLLVGAGEPRPDLVVVVTDNDGGGIFHQLEQGRPEHAGSFERIFGTPVARDLVAVAQSAGVPAVRVTDLGALESALTEAMAAGGVRVVVAHVPDRAGEAALMSGVRTAVADRLS